MYFQNSLECKTQGGNNAKKNINFNMMQNRNFLYKSQDANNAKIARIGLKQKV